MTACIVILVCVCQLYIYIHLANQCINIQYEVIFITGEDKVLSIDTHLQPVRSSIWSTRSLWKEIGRALGISDDIIRTIHYTDDGECLNEVLSKWINSGKATISDLLRALANKTVDRNDIKNGIHVLKGKA